MSDVNGPVALVTGAGRGIGAAIAQRLAGSGYRVVAADRTRDLAAETATTDPAIAARTLDVTRRDEVRAAVDDIVDEYGRLDAVVNNAMWFRYAPLDEVTEKDVDRMLDVGVKAPLWAAQACSAPMARGGGGAIVNIASVAALLATVNAAAYSAVKGAVVSLTRQLARDLGPLGIRVNAVAPGTIRTPGSMAAMSDEARDYRIARSALGRLGEPDDVAGAVEYLLSAASGFVTGQLLVVDGGVSAAM